MLDRKSTASDVWADTAYRLTTNETHLTNRGFVSRIHVKERKGKPMPEVTRIAKGRKSKAHSAVEHVFAHQKESDGPLRAHDRIACASVKIGLVNVAYNMRRFIWLEGRTAPAGA